MNRVLVMSIVLVVAGCGGGKKPVATAAKDTLTTRERQEAIGASGIPGATGINKALQVADSATARNQRLDSINP